MGDNDIRIFLTETNFFFKLSEPGVGGKKKGRGGD